MSPHAARPLPTINAMRRLSLAAVVVLHICIVAVNTSALIVLPLTQPIWVWLPLVTLMLQKRFKGCPLTQLENRLRASLGMRRIDSFWSTYIWK